MPEQPNLTTQSQAGNGARGMSWVRMFLAGVAAVAGVFAFAVVAAAAMAIAIVGGLVALVAVSARPSRRTAPPLLEGRRTPDGWTVEPARG